MGTSEGECTAHSEFAVAPHIGWGERDLAMEEDVVQRDVAGIPDPWGKGELHVAEGRRVVDVAILEFGGMRTAEIVPSSPPVAIG